MSISCDCSCDDGEYPSFFREESPVARKTHKCCECGGNIESGQKYQKEVGVWDGEFKTYRTCWPCFLIREKYCPHGFIYEELRETIENCLGFDYTEVPEEED